MNTLKCNTGNYQCGKICQSARRNCSKNVKPESAKALSEISTNISKLTFNRLKKKSKSVEQLTQSIKEYTQTRNKSEISKVREIDDGFEKKIESNVNGILVAVTLANMLINPTKDLIDARVRRLDEKVTKGYRPILEKTQKLYFTDFTVNNKFTQSTDEELLSNMSSTFKSKSDDSVALARTKKDISNTIRQSFKDVLKGLEDGTVIFATVENTDGKGRARATLYKRNGMNVNIQPSTIQAAGVVKNGKLVPVEKYE